MILTNWKLVLPGHSIAYTLLTYISSVMSVTSYLKQTYFHLGIYQVYILCLHNTINNQVSRHADNLQKRYRLGSMEFNILDCPSARYTRTL